MIIGIGTDIIEIERISKAMENNRFITKCFTPAEIEMFKVKRNETVAANFAGKEAVSKALGTGFRNFSLPDIEILRDELGKPYVNLYNNAKVLFLRLGGSKIHITISHCNSYATAFALIEGSDNNNADCNIK